MAAAIRVTVIGGPTVTLPYDEITAQDVADFNDALASRATFARTISDPSTHDLDIAAGLLWLGWRKVTPHLSFAQVAASLTFDTAVAIELVPEED